MEQKKPLPTSMHDVICIMLDLLASPKNDQSYTVLEWMLVCDREGQISYDQFCKAVKLLREAGVIRAVGTGRNTNSYTFESKTWNERK